GRLRVGEGRGIYSVAMFQLVASDISLATSFFISLQNSSYAHSAAPHSQVETDFPPFWRFFCFCDLFHPKKSRKNT
ncbi:hypothetical protein, partial [Intestinimonas timonensis]|uniref:hypothetical protein n=1 Tax=Intestinimonas timonensis TaxID=1689270 RepID=UPI0024B1F585